MILLNYYSQRPNPKGLILLKKLIGSGRKYSTLGHSLREGKIKIICKSKTSTYICDTIKTRTKGSKKLYKKFGRLKKSPYICKTNQKRGKGRKTF